MNKKKTLLLAVVLVGLLMVSSTLAYLTDTMSVTNEFTIGNVAITLDEEGWTEGVSGKNITPGTKVEKGPKITNDGVNDAYVFLKVEVPKAKVDEETTSKELFTTYFKENAEAASTLHNSSAWHLLTGAGSETETSKVYVYAYGTNSAMTKLSKNTTTSKLFDGVQLIDFDTLGESAASQQNIVVTAYAIQADSIGATEPTAVWNTVKTELNM